MRWLTNFYDVGFKWTPTAAIGIHPTKAWLSQLVNFKNAIWTLEEWYAIKFCFKLGKNAMRWKLDLLLWPRDSVPSRSMLALQDPRRLDRANPPINFWWSFFLTALAWSTCTGFPLDRQSTRNTVEVLRDFRKRFGRKRPALFKLGQWHFHQDKAPVHNSILVIDNLTKMGMKIVPQPPCDFWLFPRYETIEEMKEAVTKVIDTLTQEDFRSCWDSTTSGLQLEEITSKGTRVSYMYYQ